MKLLISLGCAALFDQLNFCNLGGKKNDTVEPPCREAVMANYTAKYRQNTHKI